MRVPGGPAGAATARNVAAAAWFRSPPPPPPPPAGPGALVAERVGNLKASLESSLAARAAAKAQQAAERKAETERRAEALKVEEAAAQKLADEKKAAKAQAAAERKAEKQALADAKARDLAIAKAAKAKEREAAKAEKAAAQAKAAEEKAKAKAEKEAAEAKAKAQAEKEAAKMKKAEEKEKAKAEAEAAKVKAAEAKAAAKAEADALALEKKQEKEALALEKAEAKAAAKAKAEADALAVKLAQEAAAARAASVHVVKPDETLFSISRKYTNTSVKSLKKLNRKSSKLLVVGTELQLPEGAEKTDGKTKAPSGYKVVKVKPGDTLYGLSARYKTSAEDLQAMNGTGLIAGSDYLVPSTFPFSMPISVLAVALVLGAVAGYKSLFAGDGPGSAGGGGEEYGDDGDESMGMDANKERWKGIITGAGSGGVPRDLGGESDLLGADMQELDPKTRKEYLKFLKDSRQDNRNLWDISSLKGDDRM